MNEILLNTFVTTLYFIALINPISKVSVLAVLTSEYKRSDFTRLTAKASIVAGAILLGTMICGEFTLRQIFRVELHSLRIAGGAVLWWVGFNALRKGVFFEQENQARFSDVALVPLACPMIAGPATIAASIAIHSQEGLLISGVSVLLAIALNHVVMIFSRQICSALSRFNLLGAMVRLTGLIVMTIGTQMVLDGVSIWQSGNLEEKLHASNQALHSYEEYQNPGSRSFKHNQARVKAPAFALRATATKGSEQTNAGYCA